MSCRCLVRRWPNDVFQAARLLFGPGSPVPDSGSASYVEELWSPIPARLSEKSELKHTHHFLRHFQRQAPSDLSLSGGASIRTKILFKLSITSGSCVEVASETKKATRLGRPRLARYAARNLARIPPSEGQDVSAP